MKVQLKFGIRKCPWVDDKGIEFSWQNKTLTVRKRRIYEQDHENKTEDVDGIYTTKYVKLPFGLCIETCKTHTTYAKKLGLDFSLDWVIDEFDSSFNQLAIASLKYHLNYAVTSVDTATAAIYHDLIVRLDAHYNSVMTDEEVEIINESNDKELVDKTVEAYRARKEVQELDGLQARRDFVEIMGGLWS